MKKTDGESIFHEIIERITDAFFALDENWNFTYINKQSESLMERKRKDLINQNIWKEFPQAVGSTFYKEYHRAIKTRKSVYFEEYYPPLKRWFYVRAYPSRTGISVYFNDITKSKKIEQKLQESELRYRFVTQSAKDAIISADDRGNIISWNKGAEETFGYKEKEVAGKPLSILMPKEYIERHKMGLKRFIYTGKPKIIGKTLEMKGFKKSGLEFPLELSISTWKIGETKFFTGIIRDITERKALERRKDEFISIASHELRTPITTIKAFAQILEKKLVENKDVKNAYFSSNIISQVNKITGLIDDLLDTGKIEAGQLIFSKKLFDLDHLIKKIAVDFQHITNTHKIVLKGKINKKIWGNKDRIEQVLVNLLTNAIKYSPNADKIIINAKYGKKFVKIGIQDFGIGVPKDKQLKVFEPFFRMNVIEKEKTSSSGLGLYICSEIIKRHSGRIWVKSIEGKGSTFYFTLPLKKVNDNQLNNR